MVLGDFGPTCHQGPQPLVPRHDAAQGVPILSIIRRRLAFVYSVFVEFRC